MYRYIKNTARRFSDRVRSLLYSGNFPAPLRHDTGEIYVFLRSHNRPLYLWATLDSLYKSTKSPCKFVLIDNASTDPQIKEVINGFERRGMFHAVHYMETNAGGNQQKIFEHYRENIGKYFFLCDTDIIIEPMPHCWIAIMIDIAERNPDVSLLGSYIDTSDFVSIDKAKDLEPQLDDTELSELIKIKSPERNNPPKTAEIIYPFRPAGRLLLAKTEAIDNTRLYASNKDLCNAFEKNGYKHGITTRVVHRHLSLMNIFDYPKYDYNELFTYINGH